MYRSAGWRAQDDAPRPLPGANYSHPAGVVNPHVVAVVPLLGIELAAAVEREGSAWRGYMSLIQAAAKQDPTRFGVFPHALDPGALDGTVLGQLLCCFQRLAASAPKDGDTLETPCYPVSSPKG